MTDYEHLVGALKLAKTGSQELDRAIQAYRNGRALEDGEGYPPYTTDVGHALTIVPPGCSYDLSHSDNGRKQVEQAWVGRYIGVDDLDSKDPDHLQSSPYVWEEGATMALAICAAAVTATENMRKRKIKE